MVFDIPEIWATLCDGSEANTESPYDMPALCEMSQRTPCIGVGILDTYMQHFPVTSHPRIPLMLRSRCIKTQCIQKE
jgi:hypothetical protein